LQAQTQGQSRQMRVTMAAQPMASALEQLARQSGQDILFTRDAVAQLRAPALSGMFDAETAARRLVAGTSLVVVRDRAGAL
ncbi:hypothetical protein QVN01_35420, partial [Pseudomonas aeruginosa]